MRAGVDCGNTRMKVFWYDGGEVRRCTYMQFDDASNTSDRLEEMYKDEGVDTVHLTGMGKAPTFPKGMVIKRSPLLSGNPGTQEYIQAELALQTRGVRHLLASEPHTPARFLTVSVGTGISYTLAEEGDRIAQPLIGNPIGAEVLHFFVRLFGQTPPDGWLFPDLPPGINYDLRMEDVVGKAAAGVAGDFIVGHLAKAPEDSRNFHDAKTLSSIVNMVTVGIARDIIILREKLGPSLPEDVVFIGGGAQYRLLQLYLKRYMQMMKLNPIFPPLGTFAGAIGAYLSDDFV